MFWRRKNENKKLRKTRSDKKIQVAPTINIRLKEEIGRLSLITGLSIKRLGEIMCNEGIREVEVVSLVSEYMQRGVLTINDSLFFGDDENPSLNDRPSIGQMERISIRFKRYDFENIKLLSELLDVTPSKTVAEILYRAIRHPRIIESIIAEHNSNDFTDNTEREFRRFMRYARKKNPYDYISWGNLTNSLLDRHEIPRDLSKRGLSDIDIWRDREDYNWRIGE